MYLFLEPVGCSSSSVVSNFSVDKSHRHHPKTAASWIIGLHSSNCLNACSKAVRHSGPSIPRHEVPNDYVSSSAKPLSNCLLGRDRKAILRVGSPPAACYRGWRGADYRTDGGVVSA